MDQGEETAEGRWKRSDWFSLASLIIAVVAICVTVAPYGIELVTRTTASILQPADRTVIRQKNVAVNGTITHPPSADQDIWLVVRPRSTVVWYPQQALLLQQDGSWSVPESELALGDPDHYQICLFLADSAASSEFHQHLIATQGKEGMPKPPAGARLLASIDVEVAR